MSLQLCLLETGETVIADVREAIEPETNESLGYLVTNPFKVTHIINNTVNVAEMTEDFMKEENKITSQFDSDPLLKLKSREVDLRAMENERKKNADEANQDLQRSKLMQAQEIAEDKLEQNEDSPGLIRHPPVAKKHSVE